MSAVTSGERRSDPLAKVTNSPQRVLTRDEREDLAIEAHGYGFDDQMAADAAGIRLDLLQSWMRKGGVEKKGRNRRFLLRYRRARARTIMMGIRSIEASYLKGTTETTVTVNPDNTKIIRRIIKPPDVKYAGWMAERLAPMLYGRRQAIEHVHSGERKQTLRIELVESAEPVDYIPPPEHRDVIEASVVKLSIEDKQAQPAGKEKQ